MSKYTLFVFLLATIFFNTSFIIKKGCGGTYYIKGIAYDSEKKPIKSGSLVMIFDDKKNSFKTNNVGEFEVEIKWMNACKSGSSYLEHEKTNKRLNPEKIFFTYNNVTISISNEWKKYGKCGNNNKEEITYKKDLHFN